MKPAWERLNPEQRDAAMHVNGPALVVAGPGTGKTTTLVARYAYLVQEHGVRPEAIFTTSFTRRSARQLRERLGRAGLDLPRRAPVGTFHALCLQLLLARGERFEILEEGHSRALLDEVQRGQGVRLSLDRLRAFKTQLLSPEEVRARAAHPAARREAEIYGAYENAKAERGVLDYEDLLGRVVDLYRAGESGLPVFDHFMIDEYQDLNAAQDVLIAALRGAHANVWAVGDDDQAIYGFRGSDTRFITEFERTYPGAKVVTLREHYRSPPRLLERSSTLIGKNRARRPKKLRSLVDGIATLEIYEASTEDEETQWLMQRVMRLAETVPHSEIAVLAPTNAVAREAERRLRLAGVPTFLPKGDYDEVPEAVFVSTIHQAKGLEWSAVLVASFEDGVLPYFDIEPEETERYEEARRLAYVAVTRAKHHLSLSHSRTRGGHRKKRSPFVGELLRSADRAWVVDSGAYPAPTARRRSSVGEERSQAKAPRKRKTSGARRSPRSDGFSVGAIARHPSFGKGRIVATEGQKITIDFFSCGRKTILARFLAKASE